MNRGIIRSCGSFYATAKQYNVVTFLPAISEICDKECTLDIIQSLNLTSLVRITRNSPWACHYFQFKYLRYIMLFLTKVP